MIDPGSSSPTPQWLVFRTSIPMDRLLRSNAAETLGYLYGYSAMSGAKMLAVLNDIATFSYDIMFLFYVPSSKDQFIRLLESGGIVRDGVSIGIPSSEKTMNARPIEEVLPSDIVGELLTVASVLSGGEMPEAFS